MTTSPAMTAETTQPAAQWTRETAEAYARTLSPTDRLVLTNALTEVSEAVWMAWLQAAIADHFGAALDDVAGLAFESYDYEDSGHYFNETCHAFYRDGRRERVELPGDATDLMADIFGKVGPRTWATLIPATGETEQFDADDITDAAQWIAERTGAGHAGENPAQDPNLVVG